MSLHPSLRSVGKGKQQRTVLKRAERIKQLMKDGKWTETSKIFGLPKIKIVRLKVKKEKAAEKPEAAAAEAAGEAAKTAAPAKAAAPAAGKQAKTK
ncbi:MAG: small basic protein [Candidatus Omnitrophica bacterium]|nr:small basic protein [Candidatus Omnitrophota bacterium]